MSELKQLRELDLSHSQVTDAGLKELASLQQLHTLRLRETNLTDAGLKHLAVLKQLKHLDVTGTQVTDRGFAELQKALPGLKRSATAFPGSSFPTKSGR